jgi:uncharacterized membrane protein
MAQLWTIGIDLALNRWGLAGRASLLFIPNTVTITFVSLGYSSCKVFWQKLGGLTCQLPRSLVFSAILVAILLVPLSYYSITGYCANM